MPRQSPFPRYLQIRLRRSVRWGERLEGLAIEFRLRNSRHD